MRREAADPWLMHSVGSGRYSMPHVHCHAVHELYYMLKGNTTYYIGDEIFHIRQGNFVFIPRGILHKTDYESPLENERIVLTFSDTVFAGGLQEVREELCRCRVIYVEESRLPAFEEMLKKIDGECHSQNKYREIALNLYVVELLVQLCRFKYDYRPALSGTDQTIYQISKYIREHFQDQITLGELSRFFSVSESHLSRKFKANTGIGLNEYITYVRITNAEKLLRETGLSVVAVAQQCGYGDGNYFSAVFKKIKGQTPQEYRKWYRAAR